MERSTNEGVHQFHLVNYHKENGRYYQFAVSTNQIPYLIEEDQRHKLLRVAKNLWILKGEWRTGWSGRGYHHCPSINTPGSIKLAIGENKAELKISSSIDNFDFDTLKEDMEGELWSLITSDHSVVKQEKASINWRGKVFNFPQSHLIARFIEYYEKVLRSPKKELIHTTMELPLERVKPIPATFKKLAIAGSSNLLPSKSFSESFDNYENRFLCWMLHNITQIAHNNQRFAKLQIKRLKEESDQIEKKTEELKKRPVVDEKVIRNEVKTQEKIYQKWKKEWEENRIDFLNNFGSNNCLVELTITVLYEEESDPFNYWVKWEGKDPSFGLMKFSFDMSKLLFGGKAQRVKMKAHCFEDSFHTAGGHPIFHVRGIKSIEMLSIIDEKIIKRQKENIETLKNNDWHFSSILTEAEKAKFIKERSEQLKTLRNRKDRISSNSSDISAFEKEMDQLSLELKKLTQADFFSKINLKAIGRFKPSMTYIQNPYYRNAYKTFLEILNSEGIDLEVFGLYEQILEYSIREIPQVYELWCLVSIIKCLENSFGFKCEKKGLKSLLETVSPTSKKVDKYCNLDFSGYLNFKAVTLHYQKALPNGKRPDFVLDIFNLPKSVNLVLDAKFKNYNYKSSVIHEIEALKGKYQIDSDHFVFILHPCEDKIHEGFSSKLTNLGGEKEIINEKETRFPFHQYGYLNVKPGYIDNLKKVIGMGVRIPYGNKSLS